MNKQTHVKFSNGFEGLVEVWTVLESFVESFWFKTSTIVRKLFTNEKTVNGVIKFILNSIEFF